MTTVERERVVVVVPARVDEVLDALVNARELVAKGWCQRVFRTDEGVCMVGALIYGNVSESEVLTRAELALMETIDDDSMCAISAWNDKDGRTHEEVLAVFDETIRRRRKA